MIRWALYWVSERGVSLRSLEHGIRCVKGGPPFIDLPIPIEQTVNTPQCVTTNYALTMLCCWYY